VTSVFFFFFPPSFLPRGDLGKLPWTIATAVHHPRVITQNQSTFPSIRRFGNFASGVTAADREIEKLAAETMIVSRGEGRGHVVVASARAYHTPRRRRLQIDSRRGKEYGKNTERIGARKEKVPASLGSEGIFHVRRNTGSPVQCRALKEAGERVDARRQVAPEWTTECNECRGDCPNGPRTNDQTLVSLGLTFGIINVGTRAPSTPPARVSIILPLVLRHLRSPRSCRWKCRCQLLRILPPLSPRSRANLARSCYFDSD